MTDRYLINFSLFCKRKNFNLYNYLLKNKEVNYRSISEFLRNKGVMPPSEVLFESIKNQIEDQENLQIKKESIILDKEENNIEEVPEIVKSLKKRNTKRKKKNE